MLRIVNIYMNAAKRIPVTEKVWEELSALKRAGQTYDELLGDLIEEHKKAVLFREIRAIEEKGEFVELD
jgi:predicted CopG family antitoxin